MSDQKEFPLSFSYYKKKVIYPAIRHYKAMEATRWDVSVHGLIFNIDLGMYYA